MKNLYTWSFISQTILDKHMTHQVRNSFKNLNGWNFKIELHTKRLYLCSNPLKKNSWNIWLIYSRHQPIQNLRSAAQHTLSIPKPIIEFYRKSLIYSGPKIWNQFPLHVRNCEHLKKFKSTYLAWWHSGGNLLLDFKNACP